MNELDRALSWTPRVGEEVFILRKAVRARGRVVRVVEDYRLVDVVHEERAVAFWLEELAPYPTTADEADAILERIRSRA